MVSQTCHGWTWANKKSGSFFYLSTYTSASHLHEHPHCHIHAMTPGKSGIYQRRISYHLYNQLLCSWALHSQRRASAFGQSCFFVFATQHLYTLYRSHDFATGRYPDTRRPHLPSALVGVKPTPSTNPTLPPRCKYRYTFFSCLSLMTPSFSSLDPPIGLVVWFVYRPVVQQHSSTLQHKHLFL
jgi:hypothetical protein